MSGIDQAKEDQPPADWPMVGDHLAMDLLNTQARSGGRELELWQSGDDVSRWLVRHGMLSAPAEVDNDILLTQARLLRAITRALVEGRKQGRAIDVAPLNTFLEGYVSALCVQPRADGDWQLSRIGRGDPVALLLGPAAEAVAQLLVECDFSLVKQCEHPDCVLWFYDRTKAHKRRWCSMALCGNRYKAAQFRKKSAVQVA